MRNIYSKKLVIGDACRLQPPEYAVEDEIEYCNTNWNFGTKTFYLASGEPDSLNQRFIRVEPQYFSGEFPFPHSHH